MKKLCGLLLALSVLLTPLSASVQFDGSDDLINAGSGAGLDDLGPATFSFWMRARSLGESNFGRVLDKGGSFHGIQLGGTNRVVFVKDYTTTDLRRESDDNSVVIGVWQHWAITYDGGTNAVGIKMFIDGVEQTVYQGQSSAVGSYISDAADDLIIGNRAAADRTFDGDLTDLAIWGVVLSNREIEQLAQRRPRTPLQIRRSSLVAYWSLSEFSFGQAVTGLVLDTSGNGHLGTPSNSPTGGGWFLSRGAPATPPPDPDPLPWVSEFTPLRTHYVDDVACGGNGTIGNPECMATAMNNSHYACGDLHNFRAGTYDFPTIFGISVGTAFTLTKDCTESNPAVWKGYVDPATGQPENALWTRQYLVPHGNWHWFVNTHSTYDVPGGPNGFAYNVNAAGVRIINGLVHDTAQGSSITRFGPNADGPGFVVYGMVGYKPGCGTTPNLDHLVYTQNNYVNNGYKYFNQNMLLETIRHGTPNCGLYLWHAYASSSQGAFPVSGFHLQDNFFGDAPNSGAVLFGHDANTPSTNNVIFRNYFVDHYLGFSNVDDCLQIGRNTPFVGTITENYFARSCVTPLGYWGATDSHDAFTFEDNEIYDPPGGDHIGKFTTRATSGSPGSHKIPNQDVWDNNIYGGTFKAHLNCNSTNYGTNLTLAQWRTNTSACRVTPGTGFDLNSTNPANPTVNKITVLQNEYQCPTCPFADQDRGNIYIVNWENASSDIVDISPVVGPGKQYVVRYARDFYGAAAASGTCPGSGACNVTLNLRRTSGEATTKFANAFVITAEP